MNLFERFLRQYNYGCSPWTNDNIEFWILMWPENSILENPSRGPIFSLAMLARLGSLQLKSSPFGALISLIALIIAYISY